MDLQSLLESLSPRPPRFTMSSAGARSAGEGDESRLYDLTVSAGGPTDAAASAGGDTTDVPPSPRPS
jgi:hypothetical protein